MEDVYNIKERSDLERGRGEQERHVLVYIYLKGIEDQGTVV